MTLPHENQLRILSKALSNTAEFIHPGECIHIRIVPGHDLHIHPILSGHEM